MALSILDPTTTGSSRTATRGRLRTLRRGFTLVEMLVVMGVIVLLLGLVIPALGPLKGSQDVTTAAYNLAAALETARNYALANNTYTWVGFYEQDFGSTSAPASPDVPTSRGYQGAGQIVVGIVYSTDGTKLVDDATAGTITLPSNGSGNTANSSSTSGGTAMPVGKVMHIYGVHLTRLKKPSSENSPDPAVAIKLQGRPYQSDIENDDSEIEPTLISDDSPDTTLRPFVAQGYTFYKTIRFNPHGEANINSTLPCTRIIELGLQPTHGGIKDTNSLNLVAIQQAGIGGSVNIYRP